MCLACQVQCLVRRLEPFSHAHRIHNINHPPFLAVARARPHKLHPLHQDGGLALLSPPPNMANGGHPAAALAPPSSTTASSAEAVQSKRDLTSWWKNFKRGTPAKLQEDKGEYAHPVALCCLHMLTLRSLSSSPRHLWCTSPDQHPLCQRRYFAVQ